MFWFHGSAIASVAGLQPRRELDSAPGLTGQRLLRQARKRETLASTDPRILGVSVKEGAR
jgi:hypothetical protein